MAYIAPPNLLLPWSSSDQDNQRLKKILWILLIPFFLLSVVIPLINIPEPDREELERLPPQLARVVIEKKEIPKPPPPPPKEEPKEEKKEKPKEEPKKEEPKPKEPEPKPEPIIEPEPAKLVEAQEVAAAEINQFADALADMRDAFELSDVNQNITQSTGEAAQVSRDVVGAKARGGSGGINTSSLSRNTGGVALSGKTTTKVDSQLASATGTATKASKSKTGTSRDKAYRSDEDIRKTMDRNKSAIFAVYNKALRKNPALEGKVVFKLVIDAAGRVSDASIVSSELGDPALERRLLLRIKLINFGTKDVLQTTLEYALDFLPY